MPAALDNSTLSVVENTPSPSTTVTAFKSVEDELKSHLNLLQVANESKDRRIVSRVLHNLPTVRRKLTANVLINLLELPVIKGMVQITSVIENALMSLKTVMPSGASEVIEEQQQSKSQITVTDGKLFERSAYILLLIGVFLIDQNSADFLQAAMESSTLAILLLQGVNADASSSFSFNHMCTFDPLLSRHYYFLMRSYELTSSLPALHNFLMIGLRTASLRHDTETEATIYNCILRLHISRDDYESAQVFLKNSPFPKGSVINLNNQLARFHFYRARVLAVSEGKYSEAAGDLCQVLRKAPHGRAGLNFVLSVTKFDIVVRLLCGEIPDRSTFNLHSKALQPYLELTQSVRLGELSAFKNVSARFQSSWLADGTHRLIERLEESVVRVGLRRLSKSYVKISFADIATKLELPSHVDVRNVLVKAIADGVLVGSINDALGCLESNRITDLYSTRVPQEAFSSRSTTLQTMHNDSVKAMRFPDKVKSKLFNENDEERRPTEEELMDEFMDADEDLF